MSPTSAPGAAKRTRLMTLIAVGLFFVFAGSLVPMLMPSPGDKPPSDTEVGTEVGTEPRPDLGPALLRFLGWTVAILTVTGVALWLARRKLRPPGPPADGGFVKVLAALPIQHRCALYLVKAGEQQVLVGVDAGGVKSVLPLPEGPGEDVMPPPGDLHLYLKGP